VPYFGAVIGLLTIGAAIRRKGLWRGAIDTALNAVPGVGAAKLAMETVRGRDLIADRPRPGAGGPVTPARRLRV
jgi:hypothetical protein